MSEQLHAISVYLQVIKQIILKSQKLNNDYEQNCRICEEISDKIVESSKIKLDVYGIETIPANMPVLFVSNHRSFFDVFLLIKALEQTVPFAAAVELYKLPYLKEFMEKIKCIPIDRNAEDINTLKKQISLISEHLKHDSLIIFPEGECNYLNDDIKEFKKGGFMSINKTDTTIIPTYINIDRINRLGKWCVPVENVKIGFGGSFKPSDINEKRVTATQLAQYTQERVEGLKKMLKQL